MEGLRNPFAVRDGNIILVNDLSKDERGQNCRCKCPACDGDFIARLGDIKIHHFAHSKEACDEVVAYTTGLYKLIHQILGNGASFYVPSLVVKYPLLYQYELNESNIRNYIKIVPEGEEFKDNYILLINGREIIFEKVDYDTDNKGVIQGLELMCKDSKDNKDSKLALKVIPPNTICKTSTVSPHENMATLALDFSDDSDRIQGSKIEMFQEYLLSKNLRKLWISNPKVEKAYPKVMKKIEAAYEEYLEKQKLLKEKEAAERLLHEEQMKLEAQQLAEREARAAQQKQIDDNKVYSSGYAQVKDRFTQQTDPICDSYGNRWVECELCGEIKRDVEFSFYGGRDSANRGSCTICMRK